MSQSFANKKDSNLHGDDIIAERDDDEEAHGDDGNYDFSNLPDAKKWEGEYCAY